MEKIECNSTIDVEKKQIYCTGLQTIPLIINYAGDIDFTELVSTLTTLIDEKKKIEFTINRSADDDKLNLIIDTLERIFESFNAKINFVEEMPLTTAEAEDF